MGKVDLNTEVYMGNLTWPAFAERVKTARGVIIPIGSCEQHGYHLPLDTDNLTATYKAREVAKLANCLVTPTFNFGQVWSAMNIPGTIALKPETIVQALIEIIVSLERHGAKNVMIISGHDGNKNVIERVARLAMDEYGFRNVWFFKADTPSEVSDGVLETGPVGGKSHAAEGETSMILYIKPEAVQMDKATPEYPDIPKAQKYRPVHWDEFLTVGNFGDPTKATAEKGEKLMRGTVEHLAALFKELMPMD